MSVTEHHEITHADGTTTIFERQDTGGWKVYTVDGEGNDIPNSPWAEFGDSYTFPEMAPGYARPDDLVVPEGPPDSSVSPASDAPPPAIDPQSPDVPDTPAPVMSEVPSGPEQPAPDPGQSPAPDPEPDSGGGGGGESGNGGGEEGDSRGGGEGGG